MFLQPVSQRIFVVSQQGIKDIDGYGHIWYGNYLKFFERGSRCLLGGGSASRPVPENSRASRGFSMNKFTRGQTNHEPKYARFC